MHETRKLSIPKSCTFQTQIREVACGEDHSCLVTEAGHVYAMGSNHFGKLGIKSSHNSNLQKHSNIEYCNTPKLVEAISGH